MNKLSREASRIPASDKLDEAKFFLSNLRAAMNSGDEFKHYLSAFLSSSMSVPDWLLYEYSEKFFGLSIEDKIYPETFALIAKVKGDTRATNFIQWWRSESNKLWSQGPGAVLHKKRHDVEHRGYPRYTVLMKVETRWPFDEGGETNVSSYVSTLTTAAQAPVAGSPQTATAEARFVDGPDESIHSLCQKLVSVLESYLQDAANKFG